MAPLASLQETWGSAQAAAWMIAHPPDLSWLGDPHRHSFRWRSHDGRWWTAARRIRTGVQLARVMTTPAAADVFVGTASWLDPVGLPRLRDKGKPAPVLLDHLVVFDVDRPPFSLRSLEHARRATLRLRGWIHDETDLGIIHVTFSGSKGFHLVCRDPDRTPFEEPDRRRREALVRTARERLLRRAIDAGHDVDRTVTADTRRVVRLPGTLHGGTGWACTVLQDDRLDEPMESWLSSIPRRDGATHPPSRPSVGALLGPVLKGANAVATRAWAGWARRTPSRPTTLGLQASTRVVGTPDRCALLVWLPENWGVGEDAAKRAKEALEASGLGPGLLWQHGGRTMLLVPRAVPRSRLARCLDAAGFRSAAASVDERGHTWVDVAPRARAGHAPEGVLEAAGSVPGGECRHPWSRPHLELARRLGHPALPLAPAAEAVAGSECPALRFVERS